MRPWQPPETTGATVMAARSRRHEGMPPYGVRRTALHTEPGGPMWASAPTKGTIEPRRKPVRAGIKPAPTRRPEKPPLGDQGEVAGRRPDGGDQNRQKLEQTIPQSRCASQLPLHKGACPLRRWGWRCSAGCGGRRGPGRAADSRPYGCGGIGRMLAAPGNHRGYGHGGMPPSGDCRKTAEDL